MQDKNMIPCPKYPEYEFKSDWVKFIDSLNGDIDNIGLFFKAVNGYGFYGDEPELSPEISDFFNTVVRPDIDRQHRKFNRKQSKRNG